MFILEGKLWNRDFCTETPIPQLFFKQYISYWIFSCWRHSRCPHFFSMFILEGKLWNRGFGTETPIPQLFFKQYISYLIISCWRHGRYPHFFPYSFLKESCRIGISVLKPLFNNFFSNNIFLIQYFHVDVIASVLISFPMFILEGKLWNKGFGTKTPILQLSFKKCFLSYNFFDSTTNVLNFFYAYFLKECCGVGVLVPKPLFHNFLSSIKISSWLIQCLCYNCGLYFFVWLNLESKSWNRGFGTENPISYFSFRSSNSNLSISSRGFSHPLTFYHIYL